MRSAPTPRAIAALVLVAAFSPVASAPAAAAGETCDGKAATIVLPTPAPGAPAPAFTGTPGDDVIVGTAARDTIDGAGGNDTICGLAGDDVLIGGEGDDRLFGGLDAAIYNENGLVFFGDRVIPGPGDDHVDLGADPQVGEGAAVHGLDRISFEDSSTGVTVDLAAGTATGEGTDTIRVTEPLRTIGVIGSSHDDHLAGTSVRDVIYTGQGSDHVLGREGNDDLFLDSGHDGASLTSDAAGQPSDSDTVDAGDGNDHVFSSVGQDRVLGGKGKDDLRSSSRTPGSVLAGGPGDDELLGLGGTTLRGGSGRDRMVSEATSGTRQEIDGGGDQDFLWLRLRQPALEPAMRIVVHLPRQRISVNGRRIVRVRSVERLFVEARPVKTSPGSKPARLTFWGSNRADEFWTSGIRQRSFGRGGNDWLRGGSYDDVLDGGRGRDLLEGGGGRDRCLQGEKLKSCELRR